MSLRFSSSAFASPSASASMSLSAAATLVVAALFSGCAASPAGNNGTGGDSGGGTGGGPGIVMKDPSAYPQNTAGAAHPYPQGHAFAHCTLPAYNTDSVATAYTNWKTKFYMQGRVVRPDNTSNPNDTVSEGIAYGMLLAVYMNEKPVFDTLWSYASGKLDGNGLMNWHYGSNGAIVNPGGGATDADEDMAWALLMADKQWGGAYLGAATSLINAIWSKEVTGGVLKPGDMFGGAGQTNPSYFAPSYYRVFARVSGNSGWMTLLDSTYTTLASASGTYGLVPNWTNSAGAPVGGPNNDPADPNFGYDACRIPWRIALDYCENGEPRALAYLQKIVGFYAMKGANGLGAIMDGYTPAGGTPPAPLGAYAAGMAFTGPGGVAAMATNDAFASKVYTTVVAYTTTSAMNGQGVFSYFNASWGVLALVTMSGNFWNMTQ
jgi:endo-1,4-beta-D-glucanase Y